MCGLSLVATSGNYSLVAVHGHLIAVAPLITEHGPRHMGSVVVAMSL